MSERGSCFVCAAPETHTRRDTSGARWRSCPDHQRELYDKVCAINEKLAKESLRATTEVKS